ncbi:hypothetical protein [Streptomyces sp. NPDC001480]|uniref:hypothetical protein n=1 Tax=Streptomyces sp. NPDC001480 TaxID=3364577 RepID=UPI0036C13910
MGLYYPYIHFRGEQWLKLAALYWPRIARVVPDGYTVRDSRTTAILTQAGLALETTREIHVGTTARETGQWLAMDPSLAWAYKCALSEHLARVNELEPLTDGLAA